MKFNSWNRDIDNEGYAELEYDWVINSQGIKPEAIDFADNFAIYLTRGSGMTTTQIRNFFGEVRKIQMKTVAKSVGDFAMLKPRIVMARARDPKSRISEFEKVIIYLLDNMSIKSDSIDQEFQNFADFIEAIVAFHKAYSNKN